MIEIQIEIPADVYQAVCSIAAERGVSLEDAVAALVRLGMCAGAPAGVAVPEPPIALDQTLEAEDEP